jgi:hypothetical protein
MLHAHRVNRYREKIVGLVTVLRLSRPAAAVRQVRLGGSSSASDCESSLPVPPARALVLSTSYRDPRGSLGCHIRVSFLRMQARSLPWSQPGSLERAALTCSESQFPSICELFQPTSERLQASGPWRPGPGVSSSEPSLLRTEVIRLPPGRGPGFQAPAPVRPGSRQSRISTPTRLNARC